jgi:hypothetical protein
MEESTIHRFSLGQALIAKFLLTDNAHAGTAFADLCSRSGLTFRFWHEVPRGHFYPGAGIGIAIGPDRVGQTDSTATD